MSLLLEFDQNGLLPAIIQDATSGQVLMLGWMNAESLQLTQSSGDVWFYSRSRQELWHKGSTSGNVLRVVEIRADCDSDALLIRAEPAGPTCHTGQTSCFWQDTEGTNLAHAPVADFIAELETIIAQRRSATAESSYTARLFAKGRIKIAQKVGEEGLEVALAGVAQDDDRVIEESADLLYHLLVLLNERAISLRQVQERLKQRHQNANPGPDATSRPTSPE